MVAVAILLQVQAVASRMPKMTSLRSSNFHTLLEAFRNSKVSNKSCKRSKRRSNTSYSSLSSPWKTFWKRYRMMRHFSQNFYPPCQCKVQYMHCILMCSREIKKAYLMISFCSPQKRFYLISGNPIIAYYSASYLIMEVAKKIFEKSLFWAHCVHSFSVC